MWVDTPGLRSWSYPQAHAGHPPLRVDPRPPWQVTEVRSEIARGRILVIIEDAPDSEHACPECGSKAPCYDHRKRRWRHLPTCQY